MQKRVFQNPFKYQVVLMSISAGLEGNTRLGNC